MATTTQAQKMEVDYSTAVNDKIPECEKLAKVKFKCVVQVIP